MYIVPSEGKSVYDAKYLMHWADSFREVRLPNGEVIHGSGDPVIFSDMLIAIGEEAPKAVLLSFIGTLAVVVFAFRGRRAAGSRSERCSSGSRGSSRFSTSTT